MPEYVCRKCGKDITDLVTDALKADGHDVMAVDVLVEGSFDERNSSSGAESFLATAGLEARDDFDRVMVTCPRDEVKNVFVVRRSGN